MSKITGELNTVGDTLKIDDVSVSETLDNKINTTGNQTLYSDNGTRVLGYTDANLIINVSTVDRDVIIYDSIGNQAIKFDNGNRAFTFTGATFDIKDTNIKNCIATTNSNIIFNEDGADKDFIINKNGGGTALSYDAGTNLFSYYGDISSTGGLELNSSGGSSNFGIRNSTDTAYLFYVAPNNSTVFIPTGSKLVKGDNPITSPEYVTEDDIKNVPNFRVRLGSSQSLTYNTTEVIEFDTENWDTNGWFNTTTHRFQPNIAGKYIIYLDVYMSGTPNERTDCEIRKNGSRDNLIIVGSNTDDYAKANGMSFVELNGTTDYIDFTAETKVTAGSELNSTNTRAWGYLLVRD